MYSRKSAGPRMESWGTPALTGYYCQWVGGVDAEGGAKSLL